MVIDQTKTVVVLKVGGELFLDQAARIALIREIQTLTKKGIIPIVVHGGGPQISALMKRVGKTPHFNQGLRVTDEETLHLTAMVLLGEINAPFVSELTARDVAACGMHGGDTKLFTITPQHHLGRVGEVAVVAPALVLSLVQQGIVPVIAPLGIDDAGLLYNINADTAAAALASAVHADALLLSTNVQGLYGDFHDKSTLLTAVTPAKVEELMARGALGEGMIPKCNAALSALRGGVSQVYIFDGRAQGEISRTVLEGVCSGTRITIV
jgi:acetylglutamate kinase